MTHNLALLVDTGPLYALATPSDQYHTRAYRELAAIQDARLALATCYPALFETFSLLQRRVSPKRTHLWLNKTVNEVDLLTPSESDYRQAAAKVQSYPDQQLSLFDALLAVLSEQLSFAIWTFDSDFDVMGANVWR